MTPLPAPPLTPADIRTQLDRMFADGRGHRPLIAIHGTCADPEPVQLHNGSRFDLVPVRSELDLRRRLPPADGPVTPTVYLVPWTTKLPLDLAGRFSHTGRVFRIDAELRLARLFTTPFDTIDHDVLECKLAAWLLRLPPERLLPAVGGRLTRDGLWDAWLDALWGIDLANAGPSALLAFAASNAQGPRFAAALAHPDAAGVLGEFEALLQRRLGEPTPAIARAWMLGRGESLLAFAVLCETLAPQAATSDTARTWLATQAPQHLGAVPTDRAVILLTRLGSLVGPVFGELARAKQTTLLHSVLNHAEDSILDIIRPHLEGSPRLLSSWRLRLDRLGGLLLASAAKPTYEAVQAAHAALRTLEQHDRPRYSEGRAAAELARAEASVRLLAWLVARPDDAAKDALSRPEKAARLGRWYAEEGGYLDNARRIARGPADGRFGEGIAAVLEQADDARRTLDRDFADALRAWSISHTPVAVLPIHEVLAKVAVPFLAEHPKRRLLVLLMDGMAWSQAVDLLDSLANDANAWLPLHSRGGIPPVFAGLPSITTVSRSAFFAGKRMPDGANLNTSKDPDHLAKHTELRKLLPGPTAPKLFLRDSFDPGGGANSDILAEIRDPNARLVAVVLNAIDASLAADAQQTAEWDARNVRPLLDILDAARDAGRAVLLASDHGHVPGDRLEWTGTRPGNGGARWRYRTDDATIHDYELPFDSYAWTPRGQRGVILITDDSHRYSVKANHAGEHGGATLAEVVAPALLLGWEGMGTLYGDNELRVRPLTPPRWWYFDLDPPPVRDPGKRPTKAKPEKPGPLHLFADPAPTQPQTTATPPPAAEPKAQPQATPAAMAANPEPAPPQTTAMLSTIEPPFAPTQPLTRQLASALVFAARVPDQARRLQVLRAVDYLVQRREPAPAIAFAAAMHIAARNVSGFVSHLAEDLNADGYAVIEFDSIGRQVLLNRERLRQGFELQGASK